MDKTINTLRMSKEIIKSDVNLMDLYLRSLPQDFLSDVEVQGSFNCSFNELESLEGCPKFVGGNFMCTGNLKNFTEDEIRAVCEVKGKINSLI